MLRRYEVRYPNYMASHRRHSSIYYNLRKQTDRKPRPFQSCCLGLPHKLERRQEKNYTPWSPRVPVNASLAQWCELTVQFPVGKGISSGLYSPRLRILA
jgi:hypothetical protein